MNLKRRSKKILMSVINIAIAATVCFSSFAANISPVMASIGAQIELSASTGVDFAALTAANANIFAGNGKHSIVIGSDIIEEDMPRPVLWKPQQSSTVFVPNKNLISSADWVIQNGMTQSERVAFYSDSSSNLVLNRDYVVFASLVSSSPDERQIPADSIFPAGQDGELNYKLTLLGAANGSVVGSINGVTSETRYVAKDSNYSLTNTMPVDANGSFPTNTSEYYYSLNYKIIDTNGTIVGYGKSFDLESIAIESANLNFGYYKVLVWLQKNNYWSSNEASAIKQFELVVDPDPFSKNSLKPTDVPYIISVTPKTAGPGTPIFVKGTATGYFYLVPESTTPTVDVLNAVVNGPEYAGVIASAEPNQEVILNTSSLSPGAYKIYAVSTDGIITSSEDVLLDESFLSTTISHKEGNIVAEPFTITIAFSKQMTSFNIEGIVGTNCTIKDLRGFGTTYTALVTPINANEEVTVRVLKGAARTADGEQNSESNEISVKYDPTKPIVKFSFNNNEYFAAAPERVSIYLPTSELFIISTGEKVTDFQSLIPLLLSIQRNGNEFTGYTAVYDNSAHAISVTFNTMTQATYRVNINGNVVKNNLDSTLDNTSASFTYSVPSVTSLSASTTSFRAQGGTFLLSVVGQNLTGHNVTVLLNGLVYDEAKVIRSTLAQLVVEVPRNQMSSNQAHTVSVQLNGEPVLNKSLQVVVTTTPIPTLTELIPNATAFPGSGGTMTMTIRGENLTSSTIRVYYDNEQKTTASINSDQSYATASISIPANTASERKTHVISAVLTHGTANTANHVVSTVSVIIEVGEAVTKAPTPQANNAPFIDANGVKTYVDQTDIEDGKISIKVGKTNDTSNVTIPSSILSSLLKADKDSYFEFITDSSIYHVPMDFTSSLGNLDAILEKANLKESDVSYKITLSDKNNVRDYRATLVTTMPRATIVSPIVECVINVLDTKGAGIGAIDSFSAPFKRFLPVTIRPDDSIMFYNVFKYTDATKTFTYIPSTVQHINGGWYSGYSSSTPGIYLVVNYSVSFKDTAYHWANDYIRALASKTVMSGVNNIYFDPDSPISKVEFIANLINAMGLSGVTPVTTNLQFDDYKKDSKYYNEMCIAKDMGLLRFEPSRTFRPNQGITRGEVSYVLFQLLRFYGVPTSSYTKNDALAFISTAGDPTLMSEKYAKETAFIADLDIISTPMGFITNDSVTRADAASVIVRTLSYFDMISY